MGIILRVIKAAGKWKGFIIIAVIAMLLITAINLVTPMFVRELLNLLSDHESGVLAKSEVQSSIWFMAAALLGLYILKVFLQFFNGYCSHIAAWGLVANMRGRVYNHIQGLSLKYYNDKQTGQLMARVMEDTLHLENLVAHALPDMIVSFLTFVSVLIILFLINPLLALLTCIPLPLILIIGFFKKKVRIQFRDRKIVSAELMGILQDNFSGIREIQVFNKQEYEFERVQEKANLHAKKTMNGLFWISIMNPVIGMLQGLGTIAVILFGGLLALDGNPMAADITAFLLYLGLLYTPVANLARIVEDIQDATTSGKRIFEVLDSTSEVTDRENAQSVGTLKGDIEFENVSFKYNPDIAVLDGVSFSAPAGSMIAIVGSTGAGKSTIISLLARFYDITDGRITVDGIDIRDMTMQSLRNQISIVLQDVFLFNGTIAENIAYGRSDEVSLDEIIEAAKTAAVHDFIDGLPNKYETLVGERGTRLSGGQKQRIALARALLRNSPILILDEATSAVDNETEREIQKAIAQIAGHRTMLIIAHRLTTIERADKILYLENGKIIESGTHKELLSKNGAYAQMKK